MPLAFFHDVDFPLPLREGLRCSLRFQTEIAQTRNQREQRHCAWFDPLWDIDLAPLITYQETFETLVAFWRARAGASFRFRHPLDHEAVHVVLGPSDGQSTTFQLVQAYQSGYSGETTTARRVVLLPVPETVTVTVEGVPTTGFTVDRTTGVLTLATAPQAGSVVRWSGVYDLPMRFVAQEMPTDYVEIERFRNTLLLQEDRGTAGGAVRIPEDLVPTTVGVRVPPSLAFGSLLGPAHRILVLTGDAEVTERLDVGAGSRLHADVGYQFRSWDEIRQLVAFFWARRGRYASFQVRDPGDHTMHHPSACGTGNGVQRVFPLVKNYPSGSQTMPRRIYRPVAPVQVFLDGTLQTSGVTVDPDHGQVTFATAPAAGQVVTATCADFDTLVRFDTDTLEISLDTIDVSTVSGLTLTAVTEEPVAITYQPGVSGRPVTATLGCGVTAVAPPAPPPLGLEFGHSAGPGMSAMQFVVGEDPTPRGSGTFFGLLKGCTAFTVGLVVSHVGPGILLDLGGPSVWTTEPAPPAWGGPGFVPFVRVGVAGRGDGQAVYGQPRAVPVDSQHLTVYARSGSGGALPILHGDPCNPQSRSLTNEPGLSSDCLGVITTPGDRRWGPLSAGRIPDVSVLVVTVSLLTASVYCSGSLAGSTLLTMNPQTFTWFEQYSVITNDAGCWEVQRDLTQQWDVQETGAVVYLREPFLGVARNDNLVTYTGGGPFVLYEVLLERHRLAGPPQIPSIIAGPNPAFAAAIVQIHHTMLQYFTARYQLGLTPAYTGEEMLGHWTLDPPTLQSAALDAPVEVWRSQQGGMRLVDAGQQLTTMPPLLRAMPKPTIPLEPPLRLFDGSSVLTGQVLEPPAARGGHR